MKYNKLNIFISFIFSIIALNSCTKNFKEINTNPILVTEEVLKPELLLTYVMKNSVFGIVNRGPVAAYGGYYNNPASGNVFLTRNWDDPFNTYYRNYIVNITQLIRITSAEPRRSNQNAMARIFRVWLYHHLTDVYGDIPYSEAVNEISQINPRPKYDTQESVYKDLLRELKEAVAGFSDADNQFSYGDADIIMHGDVDLWKRFANSLRLRLAMRIRFADAALASQVVNEVVSGPLVDENSQNIFLATLDDNNTDNANPLYGVNQTQPLNLISSFTTTDNLKPLSDPRLPVFAKPSPYTGYRGLPLQINTVQGERYQKDSVAFIGDYFLQKVFNIILINAAEVKFLKAEAALAGMIADNAQILYQQGIRLAMDQYGVASAATNTYLASAAATLTGTTEQKLEQIIVQKWLGNYFNTYEGWAEYRRTGYPTIWTGAQLGDTQGNIPRRAIYPSDEYLKNRANVTEAASRLSNGDTYMSKIWWDKKPGLPIYHPKQGQFPPETN